jgi:hypothetical protein
VATIIGIRTRALTLTAVQQAMGIHGLKGLAEIVNITEDSHQLVHRGSQGMQGGFVAESAQHTGASYFFKTCAYPELTLQYHLALGEDSY